MNENVLWCETTHGPSEQANARYQIFFLSNVEDAVEIVERSVLDITEIEEHLHRGESLFITQKPPPNSHANTLHGVTTAADINQRRRWQRDEVSRCDAELLDIYDPAQREQLLRDDEISAEEAAFMDGREPTFHATPLRRTAHRDTVSVALAEEEYKGERAA